MTMGAGSWVGSHEKCMEEVLFCFLGLVTEGGVHTWVASTFEFYKCGG